MPEGFSQPVRNAIQNYLDLRYGKAVPTPVPQSFIPKIQITAPAPVPVPVPVPAPAPVPVPVPVPESCGCDTKPKYCSNCGKLTTPEQPSA